MINQEDENTTSDLVQNLYGIAEKHIVEKDGKWMLSGFDQASVQGHDFNQTYESREQALQEASNLLRSNKVKAA